jgi:predicted PP-loop superfamily ATPase
MRERVKIEIVTAVEEYAKLRFTAPTNKEILAKFPGLTQITLSRLLRAARRKLQEQMTRDCHFNP